jgi:hypothetical protein
MPTPSQRSPNHAEFVSLREYLESRIAAVEKSIEVANSVMQARLATMNEFRDTLKDQAGRFVTRDEMDIKLNNLNEQLKTLQYFKASLEGKASQTQANIILFISILGLALSVASLLSSCP